MLDFLYLVHDDILNTELLPFAFDTDLEPWLLPLRFLNSTKNLDEFLYVQKKIHNDSYKSALKYLRLALNSTPPMYEALLPFVQVTKVNFI